jgi:hypothetical protein
VCRHCVGHPQPFQTRYTRAAREAGARAGAQGGCIIRAQFLDEIREAYSKNPDLKNLLVDPSFAKKLVEHQGAWRKARARPARLGLRAVRDLCGAAHALVFVAAAYAIPGHARRRAPVALCAWVGVDVLQCRVSMHAIARNSRMNRAGFWALTSSL